MKKVNIKYTYDELNEVYADLFNHVNIAKKFASYEQVLVSAILINLYKKLASRVLFRTIKKINITLSIAEACALIIHIDSQDRHASTYIDNIYIKTKLLIEQQIK